MQCHNEQLAKFNRDVIQSLVLSIYLGETFASQAQVLSSLISLNRVDHVGRIHQLAIFPVHYLVHHLIFTPL